MRRYLFAVTALLAVFASSAHAGYIDQYNLCQSGLFKSRVREAAIKITFDIYNEGPSNPTNLHANRAAFASRFLASPDSFVPALACSVATNGTVATAAGTVTTANADTQQALVTDQNIYDAISSQWNAYAGA